MAIYGQFETTGEVGRTRGSAVYRARPADGAWDLGFDDLGSDASYAVKVFLVRTAENAGEDEAHRFLNRARDQKRAADAQSRHWAPIVEAGETRSEAYYATTYFPCSAAKLAAAKSPVDARVLYEMVVGILQGLVELRQALKRPHGNLKPTNVLLRNASIAKLTADDVVLTDPAMEEDAVIGGEVEDLYTVGEIIHELVLRRPFPGQHTWPVPASDPWLALGKNSQQWLALTNHLLSPRAAENWLRVDDVLEEIRPLQPRGRVRREKRRSKKSKIAVAAILALAGAATFEYFRYNRIWRELCNNYEQWVDPTSRALAANTPKSLSDDPHIRERLVVLLERARRGEVELDPRDISGSDQPLPILAENAPLSLSAVWKTEKAMWAIGKAAESLTPQQLKPLQEVQQRRDQYQSRGWARLAQYAQTISEAIPSRPSARTVEGLETLLDGHSRLAALEAARDLARTRLDRLRARAEATPLLKEKINQFASPLRGAIESDAAVPTAAAIEFLTRQLTENQRIAERFEALVGPLSDAARRQRGFEVRGWAGAARHLGQLLDRAAPGSEAALDGLASDLADAKSQWEVVQSTWERIEIRRRLLESSGDRMLLTYREHVAQAGLADASDLRDLARALQRINEDSLWDAAAKKVASPEWAAFDVVTFATHSKAHRAFIGRSTPTSDDLRAWLAEVDVRGADLASATLHPNPAIASVIPTPTPAHPATLPATVATTTNVKPPVTQPATVIASATQDPPTPIPTPAPTTHVDPPIKLPANQADPAAKPPAMIASAAGNNTTSLPATTTKPITVAPTPVSPAPDPEKIRIETEVSGFVIDCREVSIAATNRQIKDAWRTRCEQLAQGVLKDYKTLTAAKARRERLRNRLLQVDGVARSTGLPLEVKSASPAPAWRTAVIDRLSANSPASRLPEMIDLAVNEEAKFDSVLSEWIDTDEQWRAAAARLAGDAARIQDLLAKGYAPADKAPDGVSAAALASTVGASDLLKPDAVRAALDPVLKPLASLDSATDPAALRKLVGSNDQPLGLRLAAWSKVPAEPSRAAYDADLAAITSLLASAQAALDDKTRAESIKTRLETDLRARWENLLTGARSDEDVAYAIAAREKITGVVTERLSPRARLNLALHDFRIATASATEFTPLLPVARKLKEIASAAGESDPRLATILAQVDRLSRPLAPDFSKMGPMSDAARAASQNRLTWSVSAEDSSVVTYRTRIGPDSREELSLVFRRVEPAGANSSRAAYVLTTEVSTAVFDDLISGAALWTDLRAKRLLPDYDPARGDPRPGPRTWEWLRYGRNPGIARSLVWLSGGFIPNGLDHYPDSLGSEFNRSVLRDATGERSDTLNPTRRQPMQYVTPSAAALAASIAGARLPTVAEWTAAYKSIDAHTGANLRDRSWRLELEHMAKPQFAGRCRPDAGAFMPAGERPSDAIYKTAAGAEYDDGILWFRETPATPPAVFTDLAGNVSELVTDDANGKVYVIGSSSISPPTRAADKPFELGPDQASAAFSDVGFRLAFSEPAQTLDPLKNALAGNWYLTSK